jgi:hypothetical protein
MKIVTAVYDQKSESYGRPIVENTVGAAVRAFEHEATQGDNALAKFPQDFSLWQIGTYDELKGEIKSLGTKVNLANAWEIKEANKDRTARV